MSRFDQSVEITTKRLSLLPLQVEDADKMADVLADERLHEFIGGRPATVAGLHDRYAKLAAGSTDPDERVWVSTPRPR